MALVTSDCGMNYVKTHLYSEMRGFSDTLRPFLKLKVK